MVRCPSCGASSLFGLVTKQCPSCGRTVCNKCTPVLTGFLEIKKNWESEGSAPYYSENFCSPNCHYQFWQRVLAYPMAYEIGTDVEKEKVNKNVVMLWNKAIRNAFTFGSNPNLANFLPIVDYALKIHTSQCPAFKWWDSSNNLLPTFQEFVTKAKTTLANNLEQCGRTQDAAKIFEEMRMYDKARELREKDRHIVVKKTDVSINLNSLLQQVKEGGLVAVFRCPHCGGKLKIESKTTLNSLKKCEHCGSEIESMDLADFLKTALS
jgi:uncharacterized protein (DUF983 family)